MEHCERTGCKKKVAHVLYRWVTTQKAPFLHRMCAQHIEAHTAMVAEQPHTNDYLVLPIAQYNHNERQQA